MTDSPRNLIDVEHAWLRAVGMRVRLGPVALRESQDELDARTGVSRVTVGSNERADRAAGTLAYRRLAAALGVPLGDLLADQR